VVGGGDCVRIADAHVDVLWRMLRSDASFYGESQLQASYDKLYKSGVATQVFALFVDPADPDTRQLEDVLVSIDKFYRHVVSPGLVHAIRSVDELVAARNEGVMAGLLSIEGGGCLRGKPELLRVMFDLGVRGMGLTWNAPNALADGCMEPRGSGLTGAGREVVAEMARLGMWIDIAHLSDNGVEDVFSLAKGQVMASHANARQVHNHPRNLSDSVIKELVRRRGWMGMVFEPTFVDSGDYVSSTQLFRHMDHILELGGEDILGLGSDFDGTTTPVSGLSDAGDYATFATTVKDRYGATLADKILFQNFEDFLMRSLPRSTAV
jgi:membrane dipeptidase